MGPLGPPQPTTDEDVDSGFDEPHTPTTPAKEKAIPKEASASDVDSEATLVSEAVKTDAQEGVTGNKENLAPAEGEMAVEADVPSEPKQQESPPVSESGAFIGPIGPPNRPPPVPPRPTPQADLQKQIIEEVELGAQQDVTEVINNVLFQTQCAIKPNNTDADGEQLDLVKE